MTGKLPSILLHYEEFRNHQTCYQSAFWSYAIGRTSAGSLSSMCVVYLPTNIFHQLSEAQVTKEKACIRQKEWAVFVQSPRDGTAHKAITVLFDKIFKTVKAIHAKLEQAGLSLRTKTVGLECSAVLGIRSQVWKKLKPFSPQLPKKGITLFWL